MCTTNRIVFTLIMMGMIAGSRPLFSTSNKDTKRLNVLLITVDTLRADRVSCYDPGYIQTPNIDSLATKGVLFRRAFAHSPMTLPSHASILLGTTPLFHGIHENATFVVGKEFLTLAEYLKGHGYSTGAFIGAYPLDSRFGLDQGFDVYDDEYGSQDFNDPMYVERKAEAVIDQAKEWVQNQKTPWFQWIHLFDPHSVYSPPEPYKTQFKDKPYEGEVAYVDKALGELLNSLKTHNLVGDTCIILTSDHGESLGQHKESTHGFMAYNSTLWIPLIISAPGLKPGQVDQTVAHFDIFPTVCDILGLEMPGFLEGLSLLPVIRGEKLPERPIYFESLYPFYSLGWAPLKGFILGKQKFIDSPLPELYDLEKDFDETRNLANTANLGDFKRRLNKLESAYSSIYKPESRERVDEQTIKKMESLGYISARQPSKKKTFGTEDDIKVLLPFYNRVMEAAALRHHGQLRKGIEILKQVIAEREDFDLAFTHLALLYREDGMMTNCLEVLRLGLDRIPTSYEIFLAYVSNLLKTRRYDEVINVCETMTFRKMSYDPEIWNSLGAAYFHTGQFEKATEVFKKAIATDEDFPVAFNNLGSAYLGIFLETSTPGSLEKAIDAFQRALKLDPSYSAAYNGLGAAHRKSGHLEMAIENWELALKWNPDSGDALYNLALVHLDKGNLSIAFFYFSRYKDKFYDRLSPDKRKQLDDFLIKTRK